MLNPKNEIEGVEMLASNEIPEIKNMNKQFEDEKKTIKEEYKLAITKANDDYKIKINDLENRKKASKEAAKSKILSVAKESFFKLANKIAVSETKIEKRLEGLSKNKDVSEAKIILDKAKQEMIGARNEVNSANNKNIISNARKITNDARKLMKDAVLSIKNIPGKNPEPVATPKTEPKVTQPVQTAPKIEPISKPTDEEEPTTNLQPVEDRVSGIEKTLE